MFMLNDTLLLSDVRIGGLVKKKLESVIDGILVIEEYYVTTFFMNWVILVRL